MIISHVIIINIEVSVLAATGIIGWFIGKMASGNGGFSWNWDWTWIWNGSGENEDNRSKRR